MKRLLAAAGALVVLLALIPGGAWALVHWGRLDLIAHIDPSLLLGGSGAGDLLLVLFTVVGWVCWLLLCASVISEISRSASSGRISWSPPGSGVFGPAAAVLVTCVAGLATMTSQGSAGEHTPGPEPLPAAVAPAQIAGSTADHGVAVDAAPRPADASRWHTVVAGDDLWGLAEHYCGDGSRWRELLAANATSVLSPLEPLAVGTLVEIPASWPQIPGPGPGPEAAGSVRLLDATQAAPEVVTVEPGDTLWGLAREHLADGTLWPRIQQANAGVVEDPDLITPGQTLRLPLHEATPVPDPARSLPAGDPVGTAAPAPPEPGGVDAGDHAEAARRTAGDGVAHGRELLPDGVLVDGAEPAGAAADDAAPAPDAQASVQPGNAHPDVDVLDSDDDVADYVRSLVGPMGALAAAALLVALGVRRRWQRDQRAPGQRPPRPTPRGEEALAAMTRIAHPPRESDDPPQGESAAGHVPVGQPARPAPDASPAGQEAPEAVAPVIPIAGGTEPVPARGTAVRLGDSPGGPRALDLLAGGRFTVSSSDDEIFCGLLASLAVQLIEHDEPQVSAFLPPSCAWLDRLDAPELQIAASYDEMADALDELIEARTAERSSLIGIDDPDGDAGPREPWTAAVFLFDGPCPADEGRLRRLSIGVVCTADESEQALIALDEHGGTIAGDTFEPELLMPPARRALEDLFEAATSSGFDPAWWWAPACDPPGVLMSLPTPPPPLTGEELIVSDSPPSPPSPAPFLRMLGPIELVNAGGPRPSRAVKQCEEYCAWILTHPGSSAGRMTRDLLVADTTRRSNLSRLRAWLGRDSDGHPYLPDAYTGRITLHPGVSSDWEQLQVLVAGGVNRATDQALHAALSLVRGAPLADAAPGEWRWAEELRTDMICVIRDIGVTLADHCLMRRDLDQARWASKVALAAAPDDELLLCVRLRTEHMAGNRHEVESLVLQITRQARLMGVDLTDATVQLLQEVMEGRARARLA